MFAKSFQLIFLRLARKTMETLLINVRTRVENGLMQSKVTNQIRERELWSF